MLRGLYSAATALTAAQNNQEVTAHNLAHVNVPGFRKIVPANLTFEETYRPAEQNRVGAGTVSSRIGTDFTAGASIDTGRSLDLAIIGDGFFSVSAPNGDTLYTRSGVFYLQPDGKLVNSEGFPVQGEGGAEIQLPTQISPSEISVTSEGRFLLDGVEQARLKVTAFEDNSQLVREGTTLFRAPADLATTTSDYAIQQGSREGSNVSTVDELIQMITSMRHFEAAQKIITSLDDAISRNTDPRTS